MTAYGSFDEAIDAAVTLTRQRIRETGEVPPPVTDVRQKLADYGAYWFGGLDQATPYADDEVVEQFVAEHIGLFLAEESP